MLYWRRKLVFLLIALSIGKYSSFLQSNSYSAKLHSKIRFGRILTSHLGYRSRSNSLSMSTGTSTSSATTNMNGNDNGNKLSVMFICLGNICRSPTAEAVFKSIVENNALQEKFHKIESCGTGGGNPRWYEQGGWGYHDGENADERMAMAARKRGVNLTSKSISLSKADVESYDYLIVMEEKNRMAVLEAAAYWGVEAMARDKVKLICDYSSDSFKQKYNKVPDPYYGGTEGFEIVLDLLDDACKGLLNDIIK